MSAIKVNIRYLRRDGDARSKLVTYNVKDGVKEIEPGRIICSIRELDVYPNSYIQICCADTNKILHEIFKDVEYKFCDK